MKRLFVRLSLLSTIVAVGALGVVYGQRVFRKDALAAGSAEQAVSVAEDAEEASGPDFAAAADPFSAVRKGGTPDTVRAQSEAFPDAEDAFDDAKVRRASHAEEAAEDSEVAFVDEAVGDAADEGEDTAASRYRRNRRRQPAEEDASVEAAVDEEASALAGDIEEQPRAFDAGPATELQAEDDDEAGEPTPASRRARPADAADDTAPAEDDAASAADDSSAVDPFAAAPAPAGPAAARSGRSEPAADDAASADGPGRPGNRTLDGPQAAALTVEKLAPAEVQVGQQATFEIHVANVGQADAHDVQVHDVLPEGMTLVATTPQAQAGPAGEIVWSLGTLAAGEEAVLKADLLPAAEGELGSVARVYFAADASVRTISTRPQLAVDVSAAPDVLIGEKLPLRIRVSNPGTGLATAVLIEASLPEGLEHEAGRVIEYDMGDIAPGETRDLDLLVTAAKAGVSRIGLAAHGDAELHATGGADVEVLAPELQLALEGSKRRDLEREATYTLAISNPGTAAATNVDLATYLPEGLEFVKADNYGEYDPQTRSIRWSLEELPAGETGQVTLTALPTATGDQTITIEGQGDRGLKARQEQTVQVEGVAALKFEVVDVSDPIEVGGETTYEIHLVNQGSKAAGGILLNVLLPPGLEPVNADGPTRHRLDRERVLFERLAELAPKADTTYRITVKGVQPGDQRVTVELASDELTEPVTREESTQVLPNE